MSTSPHQPESLSDKLTRLKANRDRKQALLQSIETLGVTNSGGGQTTTYQDPKQLQQQLDWLDAQIEALTAQLNGDDTPQPGVNLLRHRNDYIW